MLSRLARSGALLASLISSSLGAWGCSSNGAKVNNGDIQVAAERRNTELVHEDCDLSSDSAERHDANLDGRPEIVKVKDGGRVVCEAVDLNMDGVIDLFSYYDAAGKLRRREYGLDRDNRPNEIVLYTNGVLSQKLRETNNDRKIDTWDYYENGRLVREERDSTGDGFVDQWWTFNRPQKPNCAVVVTDENGDGRPDADSQIDTCPPNPYGALPPTEQGSTPKKDAVDKESGKTTPAEPKTGSPAPAAAGTPTSAAGAPPAASTPPKPSPAPASAPPVPPKGTTP